MTSTARRRQQRYVHPRRVNLVLVVLSVFTLLAAAAVVVLVVERATTPRWLDPALLPAAQDAYEAMYTFDYTDPERSVEATLAVLTGDLRDQFEADLDAQLVPYYLEVSATNRVEGIVVGLQDINDDQTEAVVIADGTSVVASVNSGQEDPPADPQCAVTPEGADACAQTVQLTLAKVDGIWRVSAATDLSPA